MGSNFAITGNTEILQVAEAVAREKGIPKSSVVEAMEQAIQIVGRRKYGHDHEIRATIDPVTGGIALFRERTVVATDKEVEEIELHISLEDASKIQKDIKVGEKLDEQLPPIEFGRVIAQTAKQIIIQKVREAEREKQYEDFKDRVGEIVNGVVKRVEYGDVIIDFGRTETVMKRDNTIPREMFRTNDRIRAYIEDVRSELKGPQIFLSRTHPQFLSELFAQEVPEIYDGIITINAVARDPGSRAKIAVSSSDSSIDPVGSCVGLRGSRVQAVVNELQGEKIDIIQYSPDSATFVVNALAPAEVSKIVIDEDNDRIEVVVPDDQLSLAIGRRGQNVRLASQLVGWSIDVLTEDEEAKRRSEEFNTLSNLFVEALNVDDVIAHLLVTEGFRSVEDLAFVPVEDLAGIEGFDPDLAGALNERADTFLKEEKDRVEKQLKDLGIKDDLRNFEGLSDTVIVKLGENGVKSLDDFADLARDEFKEIITDSGKTDHAIDELIMKAREHWFADEEGEETKEVSAENEDSIAAQA
jgi:N utilization substance protein A